MGVVELQWVAIMGRGIKKVENHWAEATTTQIRFWYSMFHVWTKVCLWLRPPPPSTKSHTAQHHFSAQNLIELQASFALMPANGFIE